MKKVLGLFIVLLLSITLVGCNEKKQDDECGYECNESVDTKDKEKTLAVGDYVDYPVKYLNGTITEDSKDHYTLEKGWKILFIDEVDGKKQVTLISAGIPIIYFHRALENTSNESVYMLTDGFFDASYTSTAGEIDYCGFYSDDLNCSTDNMKKMFSNKYTMIGSNGNPLVRALTKEDLDRLFNKELEDYELLSNDDNFEDLVLSKCIPCDDNENPMWADKYVDYWLGSSSGNSTIWKVTRAGYLYANNGFDKAGIKIVVTLDSDVSFKEQYDEFGDFKSWELIKN